MQAPVEYDKPIHGPEEADVAMRYVPDREFPPYAFLPGRDPHPTRDPEGHSYEGDGAIEPPPPYLDADEWRENDAYLWGADLYNHGYLWEAHEAWEGQWHASKKDEVQAKHVQGLIQCAAACLKITMGEPRGAGRLCQNGTDKLTWVAEQAGPSYMGLDLIEFVAEMRAFIASEPETNEDRPRIEFDGLG